MIHHFRKGDIIYSKTLEQLRNDPIVLFIAEDEWGYYVEPTPDADAPGMNFKMFGRTLVFDSDVHLDTSRYNVALNWVLENTEGWQWYSWMIDWHKSMCKTMPDMEIE